MLTVTELRDGDLELLDTTMLAEDRLELEALTARPTLELLRYSVDVSLRCRAARVGDELVAVYGLAGNIGADVGAPWLIAATPVLGHRSAFLRASKRHFGDLLGVFPLLENWVWIGNERAVRWLGWLGFTLDAPEPYGRRGYPFSRFTMEDGTCAA